MNVLLACRDPAVSEALQASLCARGHVVVSTGTLSIAESMIVDSEFGAAIVDLSIEANKGDELIRLRARDAKVPILAIATGDEPALRKVCKTPCRSA